MRNVQRYAVLAAVPLLVAACGDDKKSGTGPDGAVNGSFTATLAGDIAAPLSGIAGHAAVSSGEDQGFVMAFEDTPSGNTVTASILIGRENPAIPATGQITFKSAEDDVIGANDYVMLAVVTDAQGTDWLCASTGGSMNVSASSAARIRGSLNIASTCFEPGSEASKDITITGTFDSRQEELAAVRAMVVAKGY